MPDCSDAPPADLGHLGGDPNVVAVLRRMTGIAYADPVVGVACVLVYEDGSTSSAIAGGRLSLLGAAEILKAEILADIMEGE